MIISSGGSTLKEKVLFLMNATFELNIDHKKSNFGCFVNCLHWFLCSLLTLERRYSSNMWIMQYIHFAIQTHRQAVLSFCIGFIRSVFLLASLCDDMFIKIYLLFYY